MTSSARLIDPQFRLQVEDLAMFKDLFFSISYNNGIFVSLFFRLCRRCKLNDAALSY